MLLCSLCPDRPAKPGCGARLASLGRVGLWRALELELCVPSLESCKRSARLRFYARLWFGHGSGASPPELLFGKTKPGSGGGLHAGVLCRHDEHAFFAATPGGGCLCVPGDVDRSSCGATCRPLRCRCLWPDRLWRLRCLPTLSSLGRRFRSPSIPCLGLLLDPGTCGSSMPLRNSALGDLVVFRTRHQPFAEGTAFACCAGLARTPRCLHLPFGVHCSWSLRSCNPPLPAMDSVGTLPGAEEEG
mmetsp:Transcript_54703/g.127601  ORF Transcript_54703/g.127601 Transcript_54703/m.127601 type:complete len:245 (-) Transcript_54703:721-1455(-)